MNAFVNLFFLVVEFPIAYLPDFFFFKQTPAYDFSACLVGSEMCIRSSNRRRRNDEGGTALDFTVERKEAGNGDVWYEVLGTKPERWVMQTNFDNDEAVGYLADRLAKLGVEDELRNKGAKPGDEVRIGKGARAVEFDWDPTIAAGAEMLDGAQLGARGVDLRLQEQDGRSQRRTNAERRRQYHEMMDARQAVREAMMAERKAGHWADPSVDDDRHDETSLFGRCLL